MRDHPDRATQPSLEQAFAACARQQAFASPGNHRLWLPRLAPDGGWQPEPEPLADHARLPRANPLHDTTQATRAM